MKKSLCILILSLPFLVFSQQSSVLSSGDWYKITVEETGVHKISYNDLASYGISVDGIDPRNIGLYGNKTGMLPESYEEFFNSDLQQLAIQFVGEEDGVLHPEDYILFYGQSPTVWDYNSSAKQFNHLTNLYSNSTSYFITIGNEPGKRIPLRLSSAEVQNKTIDTLDLLLYHENEWINLGKSGKTWLGETFENTDPLPIDFDLMGYVTYQSGHILKTMLAANSTALSSFNLKVNDASLKDIPLLSNNPGPYNLFTENGFDTAFSISEPSLQITYTYSFPNDSAAGWLDFLELNLKMAPQFNGSQMGFRSTQNIGEGNISYYYLNDNTPENLVVWNVGDPLNVENIALNIETDRIWFKLENDHLLEFQAFDGLSFFTPEFAGKLENQNLHAAIAVDFLIITNPEFLNQANQLAEFHEIEDGMSTGVFTTDQVYNEFSSGSQDISALRNFIWYMNDQSGEENQPKYVLLFGDASYDYKNITENNTNFVPTYTTMESAYMFNSYASDRFFSMKNMLTPYGDQLAIGRMPVTTTEQADQVLQKIQNYSLCQSFGSWKNEMMFIGDDADNGSHQLQADNLVDNADTSMPVMNFGKCYLDFFELVETEQGLRYPEVNMEILNNVNEGVFYVNYMGHGGSAQLASERILVKEDLANWTNSDKLTLWVIASSDVANYINPEFMSLGEALYLKENAGAIGVLSSSGSNFASANFQYSIEIIEKLTDESLQETLRFGDLLPAADSHNDFKWIFLGDPALKVRFPEFNIVSTKINGEAIEDYTDTISPGNILNIQGEIRNKQGCCTQYDFNGKVYLKVFAPAYFRSTRGNQGTPIDAFEVQDSVLTTAEAMVVNGTFDIQISLPFDYYPNFGNIKLSWYAENGLTDANGFYNGLIYGGQPNAIAENDGLLNQIKIYPTNFVDQLFIEIPGALNQKLKCRIFNTMGSLIYENTTSNETGLAKIDLPNIANGMYIINVSTDSGSRNFKLLKN